MTRSRTLVISALVILGLIGGTLIWAEQTIDKDASFLVTSNLSSLPRRKVALVLGCSPTVRSGQQNLFFNHRMDAAAEVYHAKKADYLLVSGDNRFKNYDEPTAMRKALLSRGVPDDHIILDYAGFSTFDSVVRAREVFDLSSLCIISQKDHATRAAFIAKRKQLDVIAFAAADVIGFRGARTHLREALARVRTILDLTILSRKPHFLGPKIQIPGDPVDPVVPSVKASLSIAAGLRS